MKTMLTLRKLMDEVENDTLDPETTLIDAESIAVLDDEYSVHSEQPGLEDQEEN